MKAMRKIIGTLGIAALTAAAGCANPVGDFNEQVQMAPPPAPKVSYAQPRPTAGSLFVASRVDYYTDFRARQVGDLIVVQIVENSKAKKKNDTKAERTNEFSAGVPNFFGYENRMKPANGDPDPAALVSADFKSKHDAKAELTKEDTMTTSISCTVIEVMPNDVMVIRGSRELAVNGETQFIVLEGRIRPSDVTSENTVTSDQVADARIFYTGRGTLTDKQQPGWLARLLDSVWPF